MGSVLDALPELADIDVASLLDADEASSELILGKLSLSPGQGVSLHAHHHSETVFVLDGVVQLQREGAVAELSAFGAAYFPADSVHAITAARAARCSLLVCYARADKKPIDTVWPAADLDRSVLPNPNIISGENPLLRWAVAEEFEPSVGVEPTKGMSLTVRYLLDPKRGAPDVAAGTCRFLPGAHFSMHRHEPAEIYYILDGGGLLYVGDASLPISAGSAVYLPPNVRHAVDTFEQPLHFFWLYGLDRSGPNWIWEAGEDIYNTPKGGGA